MSYPLFHKGSVKNILGILGDEHYLFHYSNRYSVFDWGAMPDELARKGETLAFMADFFFRHMEGKQTWRDCEIPEELKKSEVYKEFLEKGLGHHSLGLCDSKGNETSDQTPFLKVKAVNIVRPSFSEGKYNYDVYQKKHLKTLVPLEVIFRFGIPEGSSLLKRVGDLDYCKTLGLSKAPVAGDHFEGAIIEYSTKLESSDRYIPYDEAKSIAGLCDQEFERLHTTVQLLAIQLKSIFKKCGVKLWDGKFEFSFAPELRSDGQRDFWVVDSIGPDELRLTYEGIQLSKENLRKCYRGSSWESAIASSKKIAKERGSDDWKSICEKELGEAPGVLDEEKKVAAEMIYQSLAKELSKKMDHREVFPEAWSLNQLIQHWS